MNPSGGIFMSPQLIWGGLLAACLANAAHANIVQGAVDPTTGQQWIKASTLAEGEAQGYRAATTAEFSGYLTHGGFGLPSETQEFFSRTVKTPLMGFVADTYVAPSMPYEYSGPGVVMGLLDGSAEQVGAMMNTSGRQLDYCPGSDYYGCYKSIPVNEAAYGKLSEFAAGQHDRYAYGVGGDWAGALNNLKQAGGGSYPLSYFMLSAVPEPATYALMGMGLFLLAGVARKRSA